MNSLYKSLIGNRNVGVQGVNRNQNVETAKSIFSMLNGSAAVSKLPQHSATLLTSDSRAIMNQCYRHEIIQPEPEEESEPEVTPEEG